MKLVQRGFTVIELLIVIAVVGILAGITINVFNSTGIAARDRARETDARAWAGYFNNYKSRYTVFPSLPAGDGGGQSTAVCLGTFTSTGGKCVQYNSPGNAHSIDYNDLPAPSASAQVITNIQKIGPVPLNTGSPVGGAAIGPFAYTWQATDASNNIVVTTVFFNFFENSTCPSGFQSAASLLSADPADYSGLNSLLGGGMSGSIYTCGLVKTFTYNPTS